MKMLAAEAKLRPEMDYRLVPAAIMAWLVTLLTGTESPTLGWLSLAAATAMSTIATWQSRRTHAGIARIMLMAGVTGIALAILGLVRQAERIDSPVAQAARDGAVVRIDGMLATDPILIKAGAGGMPRVSFVLDVRQIELRGQTFATRQRVLVIGDQPDWTGRLPGQQIRLSGRASEPLRAGDVTAIIVARAPPDFIGSPSLVQRGAGVIRDDLSSSAHRALPAAPAALLVALVDGDTSGLDRVLTEEFRQTGLSHLMAVSGANVAIVIGSGLWLIRRLRFPFAVQIGGAALLLLAFVMVARPEPSVVRAAAMGAVALIALAIGRPSAALPSLSVAILLLLLIRPSLAGSAGFALSVAATGGIVLYSSRWTDHLSRWLPRPVAMAVAVAAAAGIATAPLLVLLNPTLNLMSLPANILAAPAVAPATVLGAIAAVTAPWLPWVADVCCWIAGWPARWVLSIAHRGSGWTETRIAWPAGLLGSALAVGLIVLAVLAVRLSTGHRSVRAIIGGLVVGALIIAAPVKVFARQWPPSAWLVVACDVGQGDGLVVRVDDQSAVVIDTGPDPVAMDRCLTELGITRVTMLLLTHLHQDHVGGIEAIFGKRAVAEVDVSPFAEPKPAANRVRAQAKKYGVPVRTPGLGELRVSGAVQLTVIGPIGQQRSTDSDINNNSLVVRVVTGGVSFLFCGDAEIEEQAEFAAQPQLLRADVLKVPHHGSAYQLAAFLGATKAQLGLVSVGAGNDYGHPSPSTMEQLAADGMQVYRTDQAGDIAVVLERGQLAVQRHKN